MDNRLVQSRTDMAPNTHSPSLTRIMPSSNDAAIEAYQLAKSRLAALETNVMLLWHCYETATPLRSPKSKKWGQRTSASPPAFRRLFSRSGPAASASAPPPASSSVSPTLSSKGGDIPIDLSGGSIAQTSTSIGVADTSATVQATLNEIQRLYNDHERASGGKSTALSSAQVAECLAHIKKTVMQSGTGLYGSKTGRDAERTTSDMALKEIRRSFDILTPPEPSPSVRTVVPSSRISWCPSQFEE